MSASTSPGQGRVRLALSEDHRRPAEAAPWIGPLVALGGYAFRYASNLSGRQLVVAVSVPRRDFAAVLVACGWIITSPAPQLRPPLEALRNLEPDTPVRIVTEQEVITDHFARLDERAEPRLQLRGSQWLVSRIKAVAKLPALDTPMRSARPRVVDVGPWAKLERSWDNRLALPPADLAIVGTLTWLQEDLRAFLTMGDGSAEVTPARPKAESGTIAGLLLPEGRRAATWFTHLYASSRLAEQLPLPKEMRAAVLDGAGAIKYLVEIEAPVAVCILDRSVADETAAEIVVQLRNSRGEPLSLREDLGWRPPAGVEALAFTAAL